MKNDGKSIVSIIIILLTTGCGTVNYDSTNIKGIWAAVTNDSLYEEIIIADTTFYLYDDRGGDIYLTYKLTPDSIKIFNRGYLQSARKYIRISHDEFIEGDEKYNVRFIRIPEYSDTARILGIDTISSDSPYFFNYIVQKRIRESKWVSLKNANR